MKIKTPYLKDDISFIDVYNLYDIRYMTKFQLDQLRQLARINKRIGNLSKHFERYLFLEPSWDDVTPQSERLRDALMKNKWRKNYLDKDEKFHHLMVCKHYGVFVCEDFKNPDDPKGSVTILSEVKFLRLIYEQNLKDGQFFGCAVSKEAWDFIDKTYGIKLPS